ncbi:MAG: carnitine dehydratase [Hyphomicrobiales bacterium]|nr:carnitine dehydratase [Hyphomicrobiales bacterium]
MDFPDTAALCRSELAKLLASLHLEPGLSEQVDFVGDDTIFATRFRVGTAAGVTLAAATLAAFAAIGRTQRFRVDLDLAALTTQGYRHVLLDGAPVAAPRDALTGLYDTKDGRLVFLHTNFAHHRERLLALLEAEPTRESIARRVLGWEAMALEDSMAEAGAIGAMARSRAEWVESAQGRALAGLPSVEVVRIGDSPPEPWSDSAAPLSSVRVIDFTRVLAGPTCGKTLAELGARVRRIENPLYPDLLSYQLDSNRDKQQVTLDLRQPKACDGLREMIAGSDVFLQAYRPGVAQRFGLDANALASLRPGIVYASLSAYGHVGPWQARRGFDSVLQASAGLAMQEGGGVPRLMPVSPLDYMCGYLLALGAAVALRRRAQTGGSYLVRTSLAQAANWLTSLGQSAAGREPRDCERLVRDHSIDSPGPLGSVHHLRSPISLIGA